MALTPAAFSDLVAEELLELTYTQFSVHNLPLLDSRTNKK